jgi:hypothetical protein
MPENVSVRQAQSLIRGILALDRMGKTIKPYMIGHKILLFSGVHRNPGASANPPKPHINRHYSEF